MFALTFELRRRNFPDFHFRCIFLAVFEILYQPSRCFWNFEFSFFTVLTIVFRRLLHVADYMIVSLGSLNSSYIWSLNLQFEPT